MSSLAAGISAPDKEIKKAEVVDDDDEGGDVDDGVGSTSVSLLEANHSLRSRRGKEKEEEEENQEKES